MGGKCGDHDGLILFLKNQRGRCQVALEPTGNYHRPLAYRLLCEGFEVYLVSSVAAARFREAMFNSWDKNDPKDAAVILDLLKQGKVLRYHDSVVAGIHDLQEISKAYVQVTLARTRLQHSILTHHLPLYWPEFGRYWHSSRAGWFVSFLICFPVPEMVRRLDCESFIQEAWPLVGRKVNKRAKLEEIYELAGKTIALPIDPDGIAVQAFRLQLERYLEKASMSQQDIIAGEVGKENTYGTCVGRISPGPATLLRLSTGDVNGRITAYLTEGRYTDDELHTFGGDMRLSRSKTCEDCFRYITSRGFEHPVAMVKAHVGRAVREAIGSYPG